MNTFSELNNYKKIFFQQEQLIKYEKVELCVKQVTSVTPVIRPACVDFFFNKGISYLEFLPTL